MWEQKTILEDKLTQCTGHVFQLSLRGSFASSTPTKSVFEELRRHTCKERRMMEFYSIIPLVLPPLPSSTWEWTTTDMIFGGIKVENGAGGGREKRNEEKENEKEKESKRVRKRWTKKRYSDQVNLHNEKWKRRQKCSYGWWQVLRYLLGCSTVFLCIKFLEKPETREVSGLS